MGRYLYTIVCRHYTVDGVVELDLTKVLERFSIDSAPNNYNDIWGHGGLIEKHVYSGQAVEYVIKRVLRNVITLTEEEKQFYSVHPPHSILYDCKYDLKDVSRMNEESINIRMAMSDRDFYYVYGKRKVVLYL